MNNPSRGLTGAATLLGAVLLLLPPGFPPARAASNAACVKLYLSSDQAEYDPGEPIQLGIRLVTECDQPMGIAPSNTGDRLYQLITFIRGEQVIRMENPVGGIDAEPGPAQRFVPDPATQEACDATVVDVLQSGDDNARVNNLNDARQYYDLSTPGSYQAYVSLSLGRYDDFGQNEGESRTLACLDGLQLIDPLNSNPILFTINPAEPVVSLPIEVTVSGSNAPLKGTPVALFQSADIPGEYQPVDTPDAYKSVWENVKPVASTLSDYRGKDSFRLQQKGDYTVIGMFAGDRTSKNPVFIGSLIGSSDFANASSVQKPLTVAGFVTGAKYPDLDGDTDVDNNDLKILQAALNKPANGLNDLRDLDGDMKITALDSRKLVLLCTRPRCAMQ
jgi:hypothetical protein